MTLPAGLQGQWIAQGQSYSNNDTMSSGWTDSSGNSRTLPLGGGTPKWRSAQGPKGRAAVYFDGASHFTVPNFMSAYTEGEAFVLMRCPADPPAANRSAVLGHWGTDSNISLTTYQGDSTVYDAFGSTARKTTSWNPTKSLTGWSLYNPRSKSGLWMTALDAQNGYATLTNTVAFSTTALVGKDSTLFFEGWVAEILFFDHVLSDADRASVIAYFNDVSTHDLELSTPTTYKAHWAEKLGVTVNDVTGEVTKSAGVNGTYDASARVEQMFGGRWPLRLSATVGTNSTLVFGLFHPSTVYTPGAVTVASLLACWEVTGGNAVVKESNTTRFTQAGISAGDVLSLDFSVEGLLLYLYNGAIVYVSTIARATILDWRPWRAIASMAATSAQWAPVEMFGDSREYYDPDTAANHVVHDDLNDALDGDAVEMETSFTYKVHTPDNQAGELGPGFDPPYSRGYVG